MHFLIIGGSDAGIAAGLRVHELDPTCDIMLVLADEYPNYSICGLPIFPRWRDVGLALAGTSHRSSRVRLMPNHTAESIDPIASRWLCAIETESSLSFTMTSC
jgi:NADPH-dependent 2,4-dienoyl-CoA reductase/sulfur reductase-like enzyme